MKTPIEILKEMEKNKYYLLPNIEDLLVDNDYIDTDPETQLLINKIKNNSHNIYELFDLKLDDDQKLEMIKNAMSSNQADCLALENRRMLLDGKSDHDIKTAKEALHASLNNALEDLWSIAEKSLASPNSLETLLPKEKERLITKIELVISLLEDKAIEIKDKKTLISVLEERLLNKVKPRWFVFKSAAKDDFTVKSFASYLPENWTLNTKTAASAYIYKAKLDKLTTNYVDLQVRCAKLKEPSIFSLSHKDPTDLNEELNERLIQFDELLKRVNLDKKNDLAKPLKEQFDQTKIILSNINTILAQLEDLKQKLDITKPNLNLMSQIENLTTNLNAQVKEYYKVLPDKDFSDLDKIYKEKRGQILVKIDEKQQEINTVLADVARICEGEFITEEIQQYLSDLKGLRDEIKSENSTKNITDYEDELDKISLDLDASIGDDMMQKVVPIVFENMRYAIILLYKSILRLPHTLETLKPMNKREEFYQEDLEKSYTLIKAAQDKIDGLQTDLTNNLAKLRSQTNKNIDLDGLKKHYDTIMHEVEHCEDLVENANKLEKERGEFKAKTGGIIYEKLEKFLDALKEEMKNCRRENGNKHTALLAIFNQFDAITQEYLKAMQGATESTREDIKFNFHKKLLDISIKNRLEIKELPSVLKKGKGERGFEKISDIFIGLLNELLSFFAIKISLYKDRLSVNWEKLRLQAGALVVLTHPDLRKEVFTPEALKEVQDKTAKKPDLPEVKNIDLSDASSTDGLSEDEATEDKPTSPSM